MPRAPRCFQPECDLAHSCIPREFGVVWEDLPKEWFMVKMWFAAFTVVALLLTACGKNEPIIPSGYYPPNYQAPMPQGGGYYPPSQPYGGQGPSPYFQPQMPSGYPSQYTPFIPFDNYMRRSQPSQQYYINLWVNWQGYSQQRGYNQYDFSRFWYEYCPQQFQNTQYQQVYNYFDQNVYGWVDPSMQWGNGYDPNHFWQNYNYMPYQYADDYCGSGCYY